MRLMRLDLLRYGKFTDKTVTLPKAEKDFHLIVGPNEAGKSTLRSAILDLLFGIETRSPYDFLHKYSEMRLGAAVEQGDAALDFIRIKARAKALQSAGGSPLADSALAPYLGQVDRLFFDQMFGLNHERLVQGGQDILSASNDIGQILFQAAAGVGSLGQIRDELEAQANALWAKRKSGDREYYVAAAELEQAEAALKTATVRTKDWQEANARVNQIGDDLALARGRYTALEQQRIGLERVRRTAPLLTSLQASETLLAELGDVIALPENAAELLTRAEQETAVATESVQLFDRQCADLTDKIKALLPNEAILARSADIDALFGMRQELRSLDSDIAKREGEVLVHWHDLQQSVLQLGWPAQDEEALTKRLPGSLVKSSLTSLIRRHEALLQTLSSAEEALIQRQAEIKDIDLQMTGLPDSTLPVALLDALARARALGDVAVQAKQQATQIKRLTRDLASATLELGAWSHDADTLRQLQPPTLDEINALIKRRGDLESKESADQQRMAELGSEIQALELEISQFKAIHQPVTLADVTEIRSSRDSTWQAIKSGTVALMEAAPGYEHQVVQSDQLSDQRHDKAKQESEFQVKLDLLARLQQQMNEVMGRQQKHAAALARFDQYWDVQTKTIGLAGLPLLKVNHWRAVREKVLLAQDALTEAQSAQAEFEKIAVEASAALAQEVQAVKPQDGPLPLAALVVLADEMVKNATRSQERRETLAAQKTRAEGALPELIRRQALAQEAVNTWLSDFKHNLALANLPADTNVEAAQEALELFDRMHLQLQKIRDIRVNRIDAMRLAQRDFDAQAKALALDLSPDMAHAGAAPIAQALSQRLKAELSMSEDLRRLKLELDQGLAELGTARQRLLEANASLAPLLHQCSTQDKDRLRAAIANSDRCRLLNGQLGEALKQLLALGDGLGRDVLAAEFAATDVNTLAMRLAEFKLEMDDSVAQQNRLSGELTAAQATLEKIAGQADAAKAEAQRQEALARMSNAVERFIKVYASAKLLRWSIERFRESKQGPMLTRASEVFAELTQGGFCKLAVDYESDPLKLSGQRSTGELVDIEGMSEGTRDQLYLALRLAALELHLQQTVALPFIADDLFINYDDGRARAGLQALATLSESTQVLFLTHHEHLVPVAQSVFGERLNVVRLG